MALSPSLRQALDQRDPKEVWERITPQLRQTTLLQSPTLNRLTGARITIASEIGQHTGSFKFRAASGVALHSDRPTLLTASSGNFGAALAKAAAFAGKRCTVVMPAHSAQVKIAAVKSHGAVVDLIDTQRITREERLAQLVATTPDAEGVSPYDDPRVICGNGTLGREILAAGKPDLLIAPVGGGGLTSGLCIGAELLAPQVAVWGAEPLLANDAARSLREGSRIFNEGEAHTVCDGARTRALGERNFAILRERLAGIVEVAEETVAQAMGLLAEHLQLRAEPTGALGLAALLTQPGHFAGREVVCVVSGGNVDDVVYRRLVPKA